MRTNLFIDNAVNSWKDPASDHFVKKKERALYQVVAVHVHWLVQTSVPFGQIALVFHLSHVFFLLCLTVPYPSAFKCLRSMTGVSRLDRLGMK